MAYGDFKDSPRRIDFDVVKYLILLKIQNITDIKEVLPQWLINALIKSSFPLQINLLPVAVLKAKIMPNQQLTEKLFKKLENENYTHHTFKSNIWGADRVDMQLVSTFIK